MTDLRAVFFDVDGVLVDSLPEHLSYCRDEARKLGLSLSMPTIEQFRRLVHRGVRVSPMREFLLAVGFPEASVGQAVLDYQRHFMKVYRPQLFPGVDKLLTEFSAAPLKLGIVTSNTESNVVPALGPSIGLFDEAGLFFFDSYREPKPKSWCLKEGARQLKIKPSQCVYIGDQRADASAAAEAGLRFIGVTFGWGILPEDQEYDLATSIAGLSEKVLGSSSRPSAAKVA